MGGRPRRKLSVEIAEQLQHNNAGRTKRWGAAAVVQLIITPRCMSARCRSRVTLMPEWDGWVAVGEHCGWVSLVLVGEYCWCC